MKNIYIGLAVFVTLLMTGCGSLKYMPEKFDGNEYMKLAELSVLSSLRYTCRNSTVK